METVQVCKAVNYGGDYNDDYCNHHVTMIIVTMVITSMQIVTQALFTEGEFGCVACQMETVQIC